MSRYNSECYPDPTTYGALFKIEKETKEARSYRPMVYVCSPFSGNPRKNTEAARKYSRFAVEQGYIPIAPHLLFPQFMDENTERDLAMFMDIALLTKCEELWVFGEYISKGMAAEIRKAERKQIRIRYFTEELEEITYESQGSCL